MSLGITSCKTCSKLVNSDEKFCRDCGASTNEIVNCPKCITTRKKANYNFGDNLPLTPFTAHSLRTASTTVIGSYIAPLQTSPPEKLARFCTECGYDFMS